MAELTRRGFLTQASIGAAGGALMAGLTAVPRLPGTPRWTAAMPAGASTEPVHGLIAHVRNVATGEIAVMVGTREVIHRDRSLAVRLMDIADTAPVR